MSGDDRKPLDFKAPALPMVDNAWLKPNNRLSTPVTSTNEDGPAAAATIVPSTDDADDALLIISATKQRARDYHSRQRLLNGCCSDLRFMALL